MGLLDGGLQSVFGQAFGSLYLSGTLHRVTRTEDSGGSVTRSYSDTVVKVQIDSLTEAMRSAGGYTERDVRLIVLQRGIGAAPSTDDQITAGGRRFNVSNISEDPARSYWFMIGSPV